MQFVARYSYVLERMIPDDIVAVREFCGAQPAELARWSGAPGPAQWVWLSIANRAKVAPRGAELGRALGEAA